MRTQDLFAFAFDFEAETESVEPVKECGRCGEMYSKKEFHQLPYIGKKQFPPAWEGDTEAPLLEYRNCPCGSTLTWLVSGSLD